MRWIAECLAEQTFGRGGVAQRRQQEVDSGTGGIDGPVKVTPGACPPRKTGTLDWAATGAQRARRGALSDRSGL
jgi:hypothetical protein